MNSLKHVVGFSGGVDSQAAALWVRQRFPAEDIILLNSDPGGNEHPITAAFLRRYSEAIFPVTIVAPQIRDLEGRGTQEGSECQKRRSEFTDDEPMSFERMAYIKGRYPSSQARFCTEHLKLAPQRRWVRQNLEPLGIDFERYTGVRRDESAKRADTPLREWDDYFDCYLNHPLAEWPKERVFEFLREHGEDPNPLYTMGFGRVGCAPCILSNKEDVHLWSVRFPEMIDKIREWEQGVGRTFFAPCVPGKEMNWIDEVVEWSRTARGGRQFLLPMLEAEVESGSCSSKYGLCE